MELKVLSNNVKRLVEDLKTNSTNYLDFEEDYEFLTKDEKKELIAILSYYVSTNDKINVL